MWVEDADFNNAVFCFQDNYLELQEPEFQSPFQVEYISVSFSLLVLVIVYFFGGILICKYALHKENADVIPHREFWKDLPVLIKVD